MTIRQILKPGDIFLSANPMWLGRAINWVQTFTSKDGKSKYSHAGVIIDYTGTTFEALWTNRRQDLFQAYAGKPILIARHTKMNYHNFSKGWTGIQKHEGKMYAGHRLFFFLLCPPLAKYISLGLGVCSELTMKFLCKAGLASAWRGWNPDDVHDMVKNYRDYQIVFEGICPKDLKEFSTIAAPPQAIPEGQFYKAFIAGML